MRVLTLFLLAFSLKTFAQDGSSTNTPFDTGKSNQILLLKSLPLTFTTTAYRNQVSKLMLHEANIVADELALNEQTPITLSNVLEMHVTPPRMAKIGVGSMTTSNYVFYFSVGDKFSSVVRTGSSQSRDGIRSEYLWPIVRMDTNAAYQMATQWLRAVAIDVDALNRDCKVIVRAWMPEGANAKYFVPQYRVYWQTKGQNNGGSVAGVGFLMPTKSLQQLYVKRSQYILRESLEVTNIIFLLRTNNLAE